MKNEKTTIIMTIIKIDNDNDDDNNDHHLH